MLNPLLTSVAEYCLPLACERGFPFEDQEGSGAWGNLAARHPDIAARLRAHPAVWARKRRPSDNQHYNLANEFDDFGERFPFDDIPPEFRDHFPSHWNRRFTREEPEAAPEPPAAQSSTQTTSTQTETPERQPLPQYGLRNTVDLGKSAEPVDADRAQRSMSAPPDTGTDKEMSGQQSQGEQPSNVRHIPIFVEGRDQPLINHASPPVDREHFPEENFHNFPRGFNTFNKGFRQGPQPFAQQKAYPQSAFRAASPQRSQSPRHEDHFVKVPVHHENAESSQRGRQSSPNPQQAKAQPPPQQSQHQNPPPPPQHPQASSPVPPPQSQPPLNDAISLILSIQTDVLNLMTDVENFVGSKADKKYVYLDEMLTRNLIKLDNIETEGKENIRQARKEAIKCIQKCIAVLEAKAEKGVPKDAEMNEATQNDQKEEIKTENGDVHTKEAQDHSNQAAATEAEDSRPKEQDAKTANKNSDKSKDRGASVSKDDGKAAEAQMDVDSATSQ